MGYRELRIIDYHSNTPTNQLDRLEKLRTILASTEEC